MPDPTGALTPYEAALASNNAYYTLQGWSAFQAAKASGAAVKPKPTAGMESRSTMRTEVVGSGTASLSRAGIQANYGGAFSGVTGANTTSGFGYVLEFSHQGQSHVIVATRGTRVEMGPADLVTDLYATPSSYFIDAGPVHRGFYRTFKSCKGALDSADALFQKADVIHCCGHSLGGAIANLNAYYLKANYQKDTRLYTFGAPRVGTHLGFPGRLEKALNKANIYRVSHHMDPISMIPMFPFLHVLGSDDEPNCINLPSPAPNSPGLANHNMVTYTQEMQKAGSWNGVRAQKHLPSFEDRMIKNAWENQSDSWIKKGGKLVGGAVVWVLMKVLKGILQLIGGAFVTLVATPLDLIARLLYLGVQELGKMGKKIWEWIKSAASFLGVKLGEAKDLTSAVLRNLLDRIGRVVAAAARAALAGLAGMGGAFAMAHGMGINGMVPF